MVSMPRTRPPYPPEFRRQAVELVRLAGRSIPEVARELGCSPQVLRTWVKQGDVDQGVVEGLTAEEREELRRLRREVRQLRQERDILGKAVAFFAKEPENR
jgi:transposase